MHDSHHAPTPGKSCLKPFSKHALSVICFDNPIAERFSQDTWFENQSAMVNLRNSQSDGSRNLEVKVQAWGAAGEGDGFGSQEIYRRWTGLLSEVKICHLQNGGQQGELALTSRCKKLFRVVS